MTRDEIGDMIEALPEGLEPDDLIYRLVNWAVDKEREACAKVCDDWQDSFEIDTRGWWASSFCAITIRARGEKPLVKSYAGGKPNYCTKEENS